MARENAKFMMLALTAIEWKGGTQARIHGVDRAVVKKYAEEMKRGDVFPPIIVYFDGEKYWPADGFHRGAATFILQETEIHAEVRQGSRRMALLYGIYANRGHGLALTTEDKRNAVMMLLHDPETAKWSDREIGRQVGVDHKTVGKYRKEPQAVAVR